MQSLERGVGVYAELKKAALRRMFSPLTWIAALLRIPITVLERAGMAEASSGMLKAYAWILRITFLALVVFGAAKLGISVPWKEVVELFR